jgi:hypothetical protein
MSQFFMCSHIPTRELRQESLNRFCEEGKGFARRKNVMNQLRQTQKNSNGKISRLDSRISPLLEGLDAVSAPSTRVQNRGNRLDSWKEIAVYLDREVRTVQRWEKREHLPVHRHLHQKIGSIFAFKDEIDSWRKSRALSPENPVSRKTKTVLAAGASLGLEPSNEMEPEPLARYPRKLSWAWANVDSIPAIIYFSPDAVPFPLRPPSQHPKNLSMVGIPLRQGKTPNFRTRHTAEAKS